MTELQKIKFVPNFQAMTISTKQLEDAINASLRSLNGYAGSRARVNGTQLKIEIALFNSTTCVIRNNIAKRINAENALQLDSEFVDLLEGKFVDPRYEIEIREIKNRYVITLDAHITLFNMIEAREGKVYQTQLADLGKEGSITIFEFDENVTKQVKNMRPHGTREMDYSDNNPNQNRNQGNRNHNNQGNRNRQGQGQKKFENGGRPPQHQGGNHKRY